VENPGMAVSPTVAPGEAGSENCGAGRPINVEGNTETGPLQRL